MFGFNNLLFWNSLLCPPIGFTLNFLLLWLILRRTPKAMRVHSRILLQTCLFDCLLLVQQTIGHNTTLVDASDYSLTIFFDGYFIRFLNKKVFTPSLLIVIWAFWWACFNLSFFGISVQFVYRYLVLNRNVKVTFACYSLLLTVSMLSVCTIVTCDTIAFFNGINRQPLNWQPFDNLMTYGEHSVFVTVIFDRASNVHITLNGIYVFVATICYSAIFFCGWKMVRFVSQHASLNVQLKQLNRQMTRNLIIMASFPLLLHFIGLITAAELLFKYDSEIFLEQLFYTSIIAQWLPLLNPLASILTNQPYRDALLGRFFRVASMPQTN